MAHSYKTLSLNQRETGYRYNRDSFALADFFRPAGAGALLDMGAGVGVVSILIGIENPRIKITALEINPELARLAEENARNNGLENYHVVTGDMMESPKLFSKGTFDAVVSNPPYRRKGSGRLNPDPAKAAARHEIMMTLDGLVKSASHVLKEGGALWITMIHERRDEYCAILARHGFGETRVRDVKSFTGSPPILFLSEARLGHKGNAEEQSALVLKKGDGADSDEFNRIIARYVSR
ncbi:MAG: methyltransferase [Nitrospinae bacterium]|nr:methyltransferase [Nitrospinota bacterium]